MLRRFATCGRGPAFFLLGGGQPDALAVDRFLCLALEDVEVLENIFAHGDAKLVGCLNEPGIPLPAIGIEQLLAFFLGKPRTAAYESREITTQLPMLWYA